MNRYAILYSTDLIRVRKLREREELDTGELEIEAKTASEALATYEQRFEYNYM